MSREEALHKVEERREEISRPAKLDWFLETLGISEEDFEAALRDPLRHMKYKPEPGWLWRSGRATKRALINPVLDLWKRAPQ